MTSVKQLIETVCNIYNESEHSYGIKYIQEFPSQKQDLPLRSPVVSVGVEKVAVKSETFNTAIQNGSSPSEVKIKFLICVPKNNSGSTCYEVLDKFLLATKTLVETYSIIDIGTEAIKYSSTINGLILPVQITVFTGNAYNLD